MASKKRLSQKSEQKDPSAEPAAPPGLSPAEDAAAEKAAEEFIAGLLGQQMEAPPPRIVRIACPIEYETVGAILDQINLLDTVSDDPIRVDITSPGGMVDCGFAIYDALKLCRAPVVTVVFGCASSIASVIMQGGDTRLMAPNSTFMIHEIMRGFGEGEVQLSRVKRAAKDMDAMQRRIERFLARASGQKLAQIREWCAEETTFSAKQTVKYGFADAVVRPIRRPKRPPA